MPSSVFASSPWAANYQTKDDELKEKDEVSNRPFCPLRNPVQTMRTLVEMIFMCIAKILACTHYNIAGKFIPLSLDICRYISPF